ncbi:hypothetical protein SDC9_193238 [bioreactor metagenome]|uniref:Uncharacterized protein n=1 Tax=bioreactor metagenome TaxID=1076179 RepID=A0A645I5F2_9ZZZZ
MKLHHKSNPALLHSPININYINDLPLISTTVELNFLDSFSFGSYSLITIKEIIINTTPVNSINISEL